MAEDGGLLQLNKKQLLRLSDIIYQMEYEVINDIAFDSENDRISHWDASAKNKETIETLLESENRGEGILDPKVYKVWHLVWELLKSGLNFGLQAINNYSVRMEFLDKLVGECDESFEILKNIDPDNVAAVEEATENAMKFKGVLDKFNKEHRSLYSKIFSQDLQEEGISYKALIERYMEKRGVPGAFEDLTPAEQYMLSQEIVLDSGRSGDMIDEAFATARKELVKGFALIAFLAAITVADILLDPTTPVMIRISKSIKDFAASITGSQFGHMAEEAMKETRWFVLLAEEFTFDLFALAGFLVGVGVGIVLGILGEFLIDTLCSSGGVYHQNIKHAPAHFVDLPDGESLAYDIYYN